MVTLLIRVISNWVNAEALAAQPATRQIVHERYTVLLSEVTGGV